MKKLILFSILMIVSSTFAHNCNFSYNGKSYSPLFDINAPLAIGSTGMASASYGNNQFSLARFEITKLVQLDIKTGNCDGHEEDSNYSSIDRVVYAVQAIGSSKDPVFNSQTDGANNNKISSWGLCTQELFRSCK